MENNEDFRKMMEERQKEFVEQRAKRLMKTGIEKADIDRLDELSKKLHPYTLKEMHKLLDIESEILNTVSHEEASIVLDILEYNVKFHKLAVAYIQKKDEKTEIPIK